MQKFRSDSQDKFMIRMPDGMRDRIAAAAEESGRSMNAEIVARLQQTLVAPNGYGLLNGVPELRAAAMQQAIQIAVGEAVRAQQAETAKVLREIMGWGMGVGGSAAALRAEQELNRLATSQIPLEEPPTASPKKPRDG